MKRSIFTLISILFLSYHPSISQGPISRLSAYIGGGTGYYLGDLQPLAVPTIKTFGLSGQLGVSYQFYRRFGVSLHYQFNHLRGDDALSTDIKRRNRFLSFHSDVHEISLRLTFDLLRSDKFKTIPYLIAGFGYFHFNPLAADGTALQPLGTEGQYVGTNDYPLPYTLWAPSIPVGLGFRWRISCRFSVKAEITYHKTFTDYLDDVSSKEYPDKADILSMPTGSPTTTLAYSDRRVDPANAFLSRGNPSRMDSFLDMNIGLVIHFGKCGSRGGIYEDCKALYKNMAH
ncbi:MAG: hypothetical protein K1X82_07980 [Bacteroidia bacterium]|nr:hypothetical protein [Bacteroidia bacterium]